MPNSRGRKDTSNLLEEYKLASEQAFHIEGNIWKSAGLIGFGNTASILVSIISVNSIIPAIFVGSLSIAFTWIWWGIAKRWWDIQHTIILRKRHIENHGSIRIQTYIGIRDGTAESKQIEKVKSEIDESENRDLTTCDIHFRERGVRQNVKYISPLITLVWASYIFYLIVVEGGIKVNISDTLFIQILTYVGFIGIGFGAGVLVGGIRRKQIFNDVYNMLKEKMEREK